MNMDASKLKVYVKKTSVDSIWVADLVNEDKNKGKFIDEVRVY
jgi:hypothetical protein